MQRFRNLPGDGDGGHDRPQPYSYPLRYLAITPKWSRMGLGAILVPPQGPGGETEAGEGLGQQKKEPPCFPVLHSLTSPAAAVMTSPEAAPEEGSTASPGSPGPQPRNSSAGPCRPEIRQSPAPGGLELLCEAACDSAVAVRWTDAPGGLAAYETREAGAQAWLSVLWASCNPEGWFQCRLDPGGQTASQYLVPEICEFWGSLGVRLVAETLDKEWPCPAPVPHLLAGFPNMI